MTDPRLKAPIAQAIVILLYFLVVGAPVHAQSLPWISSSNLDNTINDCTPYPIKPTPETTGVADASVLTEYQGPTDIEMDGTIIENKIINGRLKISGANNVVVRNSIIYGEGAFYALDITDGAQNALIEDVEITDAKSAIVYIHNGSGGTLRRVHLHESEGDAMKTTGAEGVLVESSYFAPTIGSAEGAHADGNQTRAGGNDVTFLGNNIDMPIPENGGPGAPYKSNANFIIQADAGDISNFHIACNWLNGGNYTVYFIQDKNDMGYVNANPKLINNRFGRSYRFGVLNVDTDVPNPEICGNVWDDTGELMAINTSTACTNGDPASTDIEQPERFDTALRDTYPNPFREVAHVPYEVSTTGRVQIQVFNQLGQRVRVLVDADHAPGSYSLTWDGRDAHEQEVASGIYFFRMQTTESVWVTTGMYVK